MHPKICIFFGVRRGWRRRLEVWQKMNSRNKFASIASGINNMRLKILSLNLLVTYEVMI